MRIHEIITELDPSRRSFLKTVGKTAAGVAGAAALGNLATGTAAAKDTNPLINNLIKDAYNSSYKAKVALELFDRANTFNYLSKAVNDIIDYMGDVSKLEDETGQDINRQSPGFNRIQACRMDLELECKAIQRNHERIEYLIKKVDSQARGQGVDLKKITNWSS